MALLRLPPDYRPLGTQRIPQRTAYTEGRIRLHMGTWAVHVHRHPYLSAGMVVAIKEREESAA